MFYDNDYIVFFSDFASKALKSGSEFMLILNNDYMESAPFSSNMSINSLNINALVKNEDVESQSLNIRDILIINNKQYSIKNILYNEKGVSELELYLEE